MPKLPISVNKDLFILISKLIVTECCGDQTYQQRLKHTVLQGSILSGYNINEYTDFYYKTFRCVHAKLRDVGINVFHIHRNYTVLLSVSFHIFYVLL